MRGAVKAVAANIVLRGDLIINRIQRRCRRHVIEKGRVKTATGQVQQDFPCNPDAI